VKGGGGIAVVSTGGGGGEDMPGPVGEHSRAGGVTVTTSPTVFVKPTITVSTVEQLWTRQGGAGGQPSMNVAVGVYGHIGLMGLRVVGCLVTVATNVYSVAVQWVWVTVLPVQIGGTHGGTCVTVAVMQEGQTTSYPAALDEEPR
jgi:hypothetical protein